MKGIFMRVLFCKIQCPAFICFCKPSSAAAHLYNPRPLKLENSPHVTPVVVSVVDDKLLSDENVETKEGLEDGNQKVECEIVLKSCIKKTVSLRSSSPRVAERKRVQWVDKVGKELVDIREFESSETADTDEDCNRGCLCMIV